MESAGWAAALVALFSAVASIVTTWLRTRKIQSANGTSLDTLHDTQARLEARMIEECERSARADQALWAHIDANSRMWRSFSEDTDRRLDRIQRGVENCPHISGGSHPQEQ